MAVVDDLKHVPLFADLNQRQLRNSESAPASVCTNPEWQSCARGRWSGIRVFIIVEGEATVSMGGRNVRTLGGQETTSASWR